MSELLPVAQTVSIIVGIVTLVGLAIRLGRQAATIEVAQAAMAKELGELKEMRKEMSAVPLMAQRLAFLESAVSRAVSDIRELSEEHAVNKAIREHSRPDR